MLVGALMIVLFSFFRSADPRHWAWLKEFDKKPRPISPQDEQKVKQLQQTLTEQTLAANEETAPAAPANNVVPPAKPVAKPDAAPAGNLTIPKEVFSEINESSLFIRQAESSAYWTVLAKVRDVPQADLEQAALKDLTYTQIFSDPDFYRGRLITLEGELVKLSRLPSRENPAKIETVYEGWMINADSGKNPYVFHCLDKPAGLLEGDKLSEKVRITGYFFKRYQYPAKSGLTYAAPLLLAKRIRWFPPVQRKAAADPRWIPYLLGGIAIVGLSLAGTLCWFMLRDQQRSNAQFKRFTAPPVTDLGQLEPPPDS